MKNMTSEQHPLAKSKETYSGTNMVGCLLYSEPTFACLGGERLFEFLTALMHISISPADSVPCIHLS